MEENRPVRAEILRTFNTMMYERGYDKTTIKDVAREVGISNGHLNFYFRKKEEIIIAINEDLIGKLYLIFSLNVPQDIDAVVYYLLMKRFIRSLQMQVKGLIRVRREMLTHHAVVSGMAEGYYKMLKRALGQRGIKIDRETMRIGVHCASYGESAIQLQIDQGKISPKTEEEFFDICADIEFRLLGFDDETAAKFINESKERYAALDEKMLIEKVYEYQDYNYDMEI